MKKSLYLTISLMVVVLLNSCSSVNVLNSWKADTASDVRDNNLLVIARTANTGVRVAFENEIVAQLTKEGINATASFTKFPQIDPDSEITKERQTEIEKMIKDKGFNGVVLTVIKEKQELSKTVTDGGYYAGGNYYGYYPRYYGGFYGYYNNPMSFSTYGNYVSETTETYTATNYILETVIYDLEKDGENQLVGVVTSKLEEPEGAATTAKQYVKAITKSLSK